MTDLIFREGIGPQPGGGVNLTFNYLGPPPVVPPLSTLQAFSGAPWRSASQRSASTEGHWRTGSWSNVAWASSWGVTFGLATGLFAQWHGRSSIGHVVASPWAFVVPTSNAAFVPWSTGALASVGYAPPWHGGIPIANQVHASWQAGRPAYALRALTWGAPTRREFSTISAHGRARPAPVEVMTPWRLGNRLTSAGGPWSPPAVIDPPVDPPCYTPDIGSAVYLDFIRQMGTSSPTLTFTCLGVASSTVVVPIRRVYVVVNNIILRRVVGNLPIPAFAMSMSIDADSWTWAFSATVPSSALADLQRGANDPPVELEASINGSTYRVLAETLNSDRSFGQQSIRVGGRGKSATLAAPYAPILTFSNTAQRTAAQLMDDVLTYNAVPIGWSIDWRIDDWLVPSGAWGFQGTYIEALNAIAASAGAYIQPHPVNNELQVLARYPFVPWTWGGVTPDFELPADVTVQEGLEWVDRPEYDGVYVSGTSVGVTGFVRRTGSGGLVVAPMVVDRLITASAAAEQRGRSILSNTGRKAMLTLRLPVLSATGVITPGKFVRYVDGATTRIGLVRSVTVDVKLPDTFQTLLVETQA